MPLYFAILTLPLRPVLGAGEDSLRTHLSTQITQPVKIELSDQQTPARTLQEAAVATLATPPNLMVRLGGAAQIEKMAFHPDCAGRNDLCEHMIVDPLEVSFELHADYLNKIGDILNYRITGGSGNIEFFMLDSTFFDPLMSASYSYTIGRGYTAVSGRMEYSVADKRVSSILINLNPLADLSQPDPYRVAYAAGSKQTLRVRMRLPDHSLFDKPYDHFDIENITAEVPPVAQFTFRPQTPVVNEEIRFDGSGSFDPNGSIPSYAWDFGDQATATGPKPNHKYSREGSYTVRLVVTDNDGLASAAEATIHIGLTRVAFLDKSNPSREVLGAVADGASEVIIQIKALDADISAGDLTLSLPSTDGSLIGGVSGSNGVFEQVYRPPDDFVRDDNDLKSKSRDVDLTITANTTGASIDIEHAPLQLFHPPVILIHGLWSDASTFSKMEEQLQKDYSLLVDKFDYPSDAHFADNVPQVASNIRRIVRSFAHRYSLVIREADIVAHSMGGILANLYVASPSYAGDVNRIITIDTPHSGSETANFLLNFIFREMTIAQRDYFLSPAPSYNFFQQVSGSMTRGAVEDLQVGSPAMMDYHEKLATIDIPVRSIATFHTEDNPGLLLDLVYGGRVLLMGLWYWDRKLAGQIDRDDPDGYYFDGTGFPPGHPPFGYSGRKVEYGMFHEQEWTSDFIVSLQSQYGGTYAFETLTAVDHTTVTANREIIDRVQELLNDSIFAFDLDGFSPSPSYPPARVRPTTLPPGIYPAPVQGIAAATRSVASDGFEIVTPEEGTTYVSGDTVRVEVMADSGWSNSIQLLADGQIYSDDTPPYHFEFMISADYAGSLPLLAWSMDPDGPIEDDPQHNIEIYVTSRDKPLRIAVSPSGPLFLVEGEEQLLHVAAVYESEVSRDITELASTHYTSLMPEVVQVSATGTVRAIAAGSGVVNVENSGVFAEFEVAVEPAVTEVAEPENVHVPQHFSLLQNYPNPFNPATTIEYTVPARSSSVPVTLAIYNVAGQRVRTLVDGEATAGVHRVRWDGTNAVGSRVSAGIYIYVLQAGAFVDSKKMVLLK